MNLLFSCFFLLDEFVDRLKHRYSFTHIVEKSAGKPYHTG